MRFLTVTLAVVTVLSAQALAQPPDYSDYNYCTGITPVANKTYTPLAGAKLQKVQILMRHGDRTPSMMMDGDETVYNICGNPQEAVYPAGSAYGASPLPLKANIVVSKSNMFADKYWPIGSNCEIGQLTNRGAVQARQVGADLRGIYVDQLGFLPKTLPAANNDGLIYIRNTEAPRTKHTAMNFADGLYPAGFRASRASLTLNQYPDSIENLKMNPSACPKAAIAFAAFLVTPKYLQSVIQNADANNRVNEILGVADNIKYKLIPTGDFIMPRLCNNLPLGCSKKDPSKCLTAKDAVDAMNRSSLMLSGPARYGPMAETMKRLASGPFLRELADSIRTTIRGASSSNSPMPSNNHGTVGKTYRPFELFSAHDASLDLVLSVIADPNVPWPAYASTVILELWKQVSGQYVVRVLYEGKVLPANAGLKCSLAACPAETFLAFIESYVPQDIQKECKII
ncbi:hypothetical protein BG003_008086 [Podila horticola]|nr:hypothetical protein BG003_008086 [Podila horticola]